MRHLALVALLVPVLALAGPTGGGHSSGSSSSHSSTHGSSSGADKNYSGSKHSTGGHSAGSYGSAAGSHSSTSKASHSTNTSRSKSSPHSTKNPTLSYSGSPKRDSHGKIERSAQANGDFRKRNSCPSTGKTTDACPGYEVEHRTPLACGGSDSPSNMQWLTKSANRSKGAAGCARRQSSSPAA